jgi:cytochrome c551/c552
MPADLVTGRDAEDVATYNASVAGTGAAPPDFTPAEIFANQGCAGCHTLEAAGTTATAGPDLDEALAGQTKAQVTKSIVNPSANLTPGCGGEVLRLFYVRDRRQRRAGQHSDDQASHQKQGRLEHLAAA